MDAADVTVALWIDAWSSFFPGRRSAATEQHTAYMLRPFREYLGDVRIGDVTPLIAQEWANAHPSQVRYLREVFGKAQIMGLVSINVWRLVRLPPRTKPTRPVPTPAQFEAALERCRELGGWWLEFQDVLLFTAYTGARSGGVSSLRRSAVDLPARRVVLHEKGGKTRRVALLGRSLPAVERALERAPWQELVFRNRERRPLTRDTLGYAWHKVRGDFAGPFHSLKHFAGTWLASCGVDERDIAIQLGHTDSQGRPYVHLVRRVYVHPDHEDALERLEAATRG